jgi:hypothetical protein
MKAIKLAMLLLALAATPAAAVDISTRSSSGCAFPDTAQSICYNDAGIIACPSSGQPFYGQDASYASSASTMSFTLYNGVDWGGTATSSVTVDNRTGLMWVTNPDDACATCPGGFVSSGTFTWLQALTQCEGISYAGFSDWRLPNVLELHSIMDFNRVNPAVNLTYFPNTQGADYWTSTTYLPSTSNAWHLPFGNGGMYYSLKTGRIFVRCVRGGLI